MVRTTRVETASHWQFNLDGLKLNGAAVETTIYAIVPPKA